MRFAFQPRRFGPGLKYQEFIRVYVLTSLHAEKVIPFFYEKLYNMPEKLKMIFLHENNEWREKQLKCKWYFRNILLQYHRLHVTQIT